MEGPGGYLSGTLKIFWHVSLVEGIVTPTANSFGRQGTHVPNPNRDLRRIFKILWDARGPSPFVAPTPAADTFGRYNAAVIRPKSDLRGIFEIGRHVELVKVIRRADRSQKSLSNRSWGVLQLRCNVRRYPLLGWGRRREMAPERPKGS